MKPIDEKIGRTDPMIPLSEVVRCTNQCISTATFTINQIPHGHDVR